VSNTPEVSNTQPEAPSEEQALREVERRDILNRLADHRTRLDNLKNSHHVPVAPAVAIAALAILDGLALVSAQLDAVLNEPAVMKLEMVDPAAEAQREAEAEAEAKTQERRDREIELRHHGWMQRPGSELWVKAGYSIAGRPWFSFDQAWARLLSDLGRTS
jgi:hypothetical protein